MFNDFISAWKSQQKLHTESLSTKLGYSPNFLLTYRKFLFQIVKNIILTDYSGSIF